MSDGDGPLFKNLGPFVRASDPATSQEAAKGARSYIPHVAEDITEIASDGVSRNDTELHLALEVAGKKHYLHPGKPWCLSNVQKGRKALSDAGWLVATITKPALRSQGGGGRASQAWCRALQPPAFSEVLAMWKLSQKGDLRVFNMKRCQELLDEMGNWSQSVKTPMISWLQDTLKSRIKLLKLRAARNKKPK